jgi:hypothetical protein
MRELNYEERLIKIVKVAQKWLERSVGNTSELDKVILEVAFGRATELSHTIVAELQFSYEEEAEWVNTWVQIGLFAGFMVGWSALRTLPVGIPATYEGAIGPAHMAAYGIADKVFGKLMQEPKSPLVLGLPQSQLNFLKESLERSLFTGYLEGITHADEARNTSLSSFDFNSIVDV